MRLISNLKLIFKYQFKHNEKLNECKYNFSSQFVKGIDLSTIDLLIKESNERLKVLYDAFIMINNRAYALLTIVFTISIGVLGIDVIFNNLKSNIALVAIFYAFGFIESALLLMLISPKRIYYPGVYPKEYDVEDFFKTGVVERRVKLSRLKCLNDEIKKMTDIQVVRSVILSYAISLFLIFLIVYPIVILLSNI